MVCLDVGNCRGGITPSRQVNRNAPGQVRLDVLVRQKLGKHVEFLGQELVGEVDGGVEDTEAVLAHGRRDGLDLDGVEVLGGVARPAFHEQLRKGGQGTGERS